MREASRTHHVGTPAELTSDENAWRVGDTVRYDDFLNLVTERVLDGLAQVLELSSFILTLFLLLLSLFELEPLLGHAHQLLAVELLELCDGILVDGVYEEEDLEALLLENLEEG